MSRGGGDEPGVADETKQLFHLVLSPYLLTARDPAALTAMLLGDHVTTLLPVPQGALDRVSVRAAMRRSPRFARLLESWRWIAPVFEAGVAGSTARGRDPVEDAGACRERIESADPSGQRADGRRRARRGEAASDAPAGGLRGFLHEGPISGTPEALERLSDDLAKGGPDPGLSVPILGGLDAFASSVGGVTVRAGSRGAGGPAARNAGAHWRGSVAQRAEALLAQPVFSVGMPIYTQADGETLLEARRALAGPLAGVRRAMAEAFAAAGEAGGAQAVRSAGVAEAARVYSHAFAQFIGVRGRGGDGADGVQVLDGFVRVSGVLLPEDAAVRAAEAAGAGLLRAQGSGVRGRGGREDARPGGAPPRRTLPALVIEALAIRPV